MIALAGPSSTIACRLCGRRADFLFRQTILDRYDTGYFRCPNCDLIQTEEPTWLGEAYTSVICAADAGAIRRNQLTADLTTAVGRLLGLSADCKCLDYGGGHGVFVRMMRDRGWDFRLYDRYAKNIYARGFSGPCDERYVMVTAFEVLEHLVGVVSELDDIFSSRPTAVLVSTQLHGGHEPGWWYYTPQTGQHVAFYSEHTMRHIAGRYGYMATGSRAYTLFIRGDANIPDWRRAAAEWLVSHSKGDRNDWRIKMILSLTPQLPSRTLADSGI